MFFPPLYILADYSTERKSLIYSSKALTMTSVTVRPSEKALALTAPQRSLETRMVRVGVLGALGIEIVYTETSSKNALSVPTVKLTPPSVFMPSPSMIALATAIFCTNIAC